MRRPPRTPQRNNNLSPTPPSPDLLAPRSLLAAHSPSPPLATSNPPIDAVSASLHWMTVGRDPTISELKYLHARWPGRVVWRSEDALLPQLPTDWPVPLAEDRRPAPTWLRRVLRHLYPDPRDRKSTRLNSSH